MLDADGRVEPRLHLNDTPGVTGGQVRCIFISATKQLLAFWLAATGLSVLLQVALGPPLSSGPFGSLVVPVGQALVIATASGLISLVALLPGCLLRHPAAGVQLRAGLFLIGSVVAMAIRFGGTVALFVACRYQFGSSTEALAVLVCGWYVLLTSAEIFLLARGSSSMGSGPSPSADRSSNFLNAHIGTPQTPLTESTPG